MKNVDKQLGTKVRRTTIPSAMFKNTSGFLGVDGVYTYSKINLKNLGQIDNNTDFQKKVMDKVKSLKSKEGYRINENIDDDTLTDQTNQVQKEANDFGASALKFYSAIPSINRDLTIQKGLGQYLTNGKSDMIVLNPLFESYLMANALHVTAQSMRKEIQLRQEIGEKIDNAIQSGDLETMKSYQKEWRTNDQKQKLNNAIATAQVAYDKQKKIDELNNKLASAKTDEERKAIANQISDLTGSVAKQFGIPKGLIYFGVGIAVVVGIWVTIRAIRSN